jgi:hypothetical protein
VGDCDQIEIASPAFLPLEFPHGEIVSHSESIVVRLESRAGTRGRQYARLFVDDPSSELSPASLDL